MGKPWSGFSGLALVAAAAGSFSTFAVPVVRAEEETAPFSVPAQDPQDAQPRPEPSLSAEVLQLPELEIQRVAPPNQTQAASPMVGDELPFAISGIAVPAGTDLQKDFRIEDAAGDDHLMTSGWQLVDAENKLQGSGDFRFTATALKSGKARMPVLVLKDSAGKSLARTKPFELDIGSAISPADPQPNQMADARPPMSLPFPWWVALLIGLAALGILSGGIYLLYRWNQKRKALALIKPVEPPRPEDELALSKLSDLDKKGFVKQGKFKPHYFGVSEIFKEYLGKRFGFDAAESTTYEIVRYFEDRKPVSDKVIDQIETLYEKLDRVKFSDHSPAAEEPSWIMDEARKLIQLTRRIPVQTQLLPPGAVRQEGEVTRAP